MKLYEFVNECLCCAGVEKVFGVPGSLIMPIWQNLKNIEIVLCGHEQEASYVAAGYSKMSRKPTCVLTTGGPGVTNCISGVATANIDSVPLIYISGRTPISKNGFGLKQEESRWNRMFDSTDILKSITKTSVCIDNIQTAPQMIQNTIQSAIAGRNGAVHLSIPVDLQQAEVIAKRVEFNHQKHANYKPSLNISKKPLFVIGWGCWMSNSYNEVYSLAEKVNAPIVVSSKAYCCIKRDHKMFLGKLGYGYNKELDEFIADYKPDSIISFGSSLGNKDLKSICIQGLIRNLPTIIVSNDGCSATQENNNYFVIDTYDMKKYLHKIIASTERRPERKELEHSISLAKEKAMSYWTNRISLYDHMAQCINYICKVIDHGCVITADAGNHLENSGALIMPKVPGQMFLDVGLRAMGTGICTAVGMAIANQNKKYLAITGDGCMLMNGNVMHLACELKLPVIFIVFNNRSLGRVRVGQSLTRNYCGSDIHNVDFLSYAKAFGLDTVRFDSPEKFIAEFREILICNKTMLVEIITDKDEVPVSIKDNIF